MGSSKRLVFCWLHFGGVKGADFFFSREFGGCVCVVFCRDLFLGFDLCVIIDSYMCIFFSIFPFILSYIYIFGLKFYEKVKRKLL